MASHDPFSKNYSENTPTPIPPPACVVSEGEILQCLIQAPKPFVGDGINEKAVAVTALLHRAGGRVVTRGMIDRAVGDGYNKQKHWPDNDVEMLETIAESVTALLTRAGGRVVDVDALMKELRCLPCVSEKLTVYDVLAMENAILTAIAGKGE